MSGWTFPKSLLMGSKQSEKACKSIGLCMAAENILIAYNMRPVAGLKFSLAKAVNQRKLRSELV